MDIKATYSPEDNKLRLYASERLDADTFARVKAAGYKWAPKQELFVAPKWSVSREDLAIQLAGEIEAEQSTLAERAEAKAARLDDLANKRAQEANAFQRAARDISERFAMGQPILVGHHSERKARKDKERMDAAASKAVKASNAVGYWMYKAEGVERHANRKNDPKVRARRIKTLLAELRDLQRTLNSAYTSLATWEKMNTPEEISSFLNYSNLAYATYGTWADVTSGKRTPEDAKAECVARCERTINSDNLSRWISHTLNRLSYEVEMQGGAPRFEGEITPTLLQMFVREHGADKPKGAKVDEDLFTIETRAPLPAHVGNGYSLELNADEWRDLMQACGYVPPAKKAAKPPILNFKAETVTIASRASYRGAPTSEILRQVEMTKDEYKNARGGSWVALSDCKGFRVRTTSDPHHKGAYYLAARVAVFLTDSKEHETPDHLSPGPSATASCDYEQTELNL